MPNPVLAGLMMGFTELLGFIDLAFGTDFAQNGVSYLTVGMEKLVELVEKIIF